MIAAIAALGRYYVHVVNQNSSMMPYVDINIETFNLWAVGDGNLDSNTLTGTTTTPSLDVDASAWLWVSADELAKLEITATPGDTLDIGVELFNTPALENGLGSFAVQYSDDGADAEVETLIGTIDDGLQEGIVFLRVTSLSGSNTVDVTATLTIPDFYTETEPNDDISIANDAGMLTWDDVTNEPTTERITGINLDGPEDVNGFPGTSNDWFKITIDALSEVNLSVYGTENPDQDLTLFVLNRSQELIAGGFNSPSITEIMEPSDYYVGVISNTPAGDQQGEYVLNATILRVLACTPTEQACNGDDVNICSADGSELVSFTCALGCSVDMNDNAACNTVPEIEPNNDTLEI
jgi:hypothetical protein